MVKAIHKEKFKKVRKIIETGEYEFAENPNWDFRKGGSEMVYGEFPKFLYNGINLYLKEKFPQIFSQKFIPASLDDGKYTPAYIEFCNNWDEKCRADGKFIGYDGEIYYNLSLPRKSYKIKDVGNLIIKENKLIVSEPYRRNGKLELMIMSYDPSIEGGYEPKRWGASIHYKGEQPGKLIKAAIEYINSEKKRLNAPLWKKTK